MPHKVTAPQRRAILAALVGCPSDSDYPELAAVYYARIGDVVGVAAEAVRTVRLREAQRRSLRGRVRRLAVLVEWSGDDQSLLEHVVDAAIRLAEARGRGAGTSAPPQRSAGEGEADRVTDCGRSADRVRSRSLAPAEAREGVSGDRDPRRRTPRGSAGAAVARRVGVEPLRNVRRVTGEGADR